MEIVSPESENRRRTASGRQHSSTRERLLRELESRASASTIELVEITGLHENTVRGHLEQLRADGFLRREREDPIGRGRPAWRWRSVEPTQLSSYAGLAVSLADALADAVDDPFAEARRAGVAWGTRLVTERETDDHGPGDERTRERVARGVVIDVMREQGFAPDQVKPDDTDAEIDTIRLRSCPLLSAAARNQTVVCAVHEGMVEGIAQTAGSALHSRLVPFAEDGACLLHLRVPA